MKKISKFIFAFGFIIAAGANVVQAVQIIATGDAKSISLITYSIFILLHLNGIYYSLRIMKDVILLMGTIANALVSIVIIILKLYYG